MTTPSTTPTTQDSASLPPGWKVCIDDLAKGVPSVMAIQDVYAALPPPALLDTVAIIVGSVYGDTYWQNTQMSVQALSRDLQGAGFGQQAADSSASKAFANWRGLFMRKDVNDIGAIPYQGASPSNSVDIVCNQGGQLTRSTLLNRWNEQFWDYATVGKNFVYARGTSINFPAKIAVGPAVAGKALAAMYFSDAGFNIPPTSWHECLTLGGKQTMPLETTPIEPQARWVCSTSDPFIFQPPTTGHYCLVAVVQSEFFANDPTKIDPGSNWSSWTWLTYNGAAAWHNIDAQRAAVTRLKYYNLDGRPERFIFEAQCDRLPAGTTVALRCAEPQLAGQLAMAPAKIQGDHQVIRAEALVPAGHAGELEVHITTPDGKLLPAGAAVDVRMLWVLEHGHTRYADACAATGAVSQTLHAQPLQLGMGNFTILGQAR